MKFKRNDDIVVHNDNNGCVLLNLSNGNFYGVHDLSLKIWEMVDLFETDEIVDRLANMFKSINKEEIMNDVNSFLKELIKEGLIKEYEETV